jgi:hypothetical protein
MSSRTFSRSSAIIAGLTLVAFVAAARGDFTLVSQNLTINRRDHVADFSLTFNEAPDFFSVDAYGRPLESFQYSFNGNYTLGDDQAFLDNLTAIVRGDEIHLGDRVRIRLPDGDGGPDSGGWGPVTAAVPFKLIGDKMSFSVPTADLGYVGPYYQYEVFSLDDGSTTSDKTITVIPLPSAFWSGLVGLGIAAAAGSRLRRAKA